MAAPKVRVQKISASEESIDLEKWVKRCVVLRAEAEISAREIEDELKVLYPNWTYLGC
jgi:hypothetical protein